LVGEATIADASHDAIVAGGGHHSLIIAAEKTGMSIINFFYDAIKIIILTCLYREIY